MFWVDRRLARLEEKVEILSRFLEGSLSQSPIQQRELERLLKEADDKLFGR